MPNLSSFKAEDLDQWRRQEVTKAVREWLVNRHLCLVDAALALGKNGTSGAQGAAGGALETEELIALFTEGNDFEQQADTEDRI